MQLGNLVRLTGVFVLCHMILSGNGPVETAEKNSPAATQQPGCCEQPGCLPAEKDRSPIAVAVSPDGRFCVSANHTAGSVSLVDLRKAKVVSEHRCGRGPADLVWIDETHILVSLLHDDSAAILKLDRSRQRLEMETVIPVGDEPRGIALAAEGREPDKGSRPATRAFIAITGTDEVAVLDLRTRKVAQRFAVGGRPRTIAVAPNQKWVVTCCSAPGEVYVHDATTHTFISKRLIFDDAFNVGVPVVLPDSSACIIPSPINRSLPVSFDNIEKGWVIDNRLSKLPLPGGEYWQQKQLGLDPRGNAVGDPYACALSPDARFLAVTAGGTHELLVLDRSKFTWPPGDPGDFIPPELLDDEAAFRRVKLGGRPLGVKFIDEKRVVVANYLSNSLQIVDVTTGRLEQTLRLGGPNKPNLARRGEAIFYDARRSLNSWFSCHTCHIDGHTSGQVFDTLNDGSFDTYKLSPTLRGVTETAPWTWHGWQKSLTAAMRKSMKDTLNTEQLLTDDDVAAMLAYLKSLKHPPSPYRKQDGSLTAEAARGRKLFRGKAGCADCHQGTTFTSDETYTVGLESKRYFYPEFNPPSLRGLHARRRFLHDGRGDSLQEVLKQYHRPEKLTGKKLNAEELNDLIAYLRSI